MNNKLINILIVEDETIVAMDLKSKIQKMGFNVAAITTSEEEIQNLLQEVPINLALIDINLKGFTSGINIAETLSKNYDIPIIFITAHSEKNIITRCMKINPFGYLVKPFQEKDLYISVRIALNNHYVLKNQNVSISLLNNISKNNIIISFNSVGKIVSCNDFALKLLGYTSEEMCNLHFTEIISDDQKYKYKRDIVNIVKYKKINTSYELIDKDNNTFRVFGVAEYIHKENNQFEVYSISHIIDEYYFFKNCEKKQYLFDEFCDNSLELIFN